MWGLLAKQALKGGIKKVAKDRLLNRKKKTPQKRVSGKEVSAGVMNKGKPGTLAVRPTTSLVHSARDFDPVSTSAGESDIVIIRKQVIQVRDILKDSHTAKEAEKKNLKKAKQLDKKKKEEDKVEEPKVKPKQAKAGMKMPSLGLGIGTFFTWLAVGLIFARLEKLMPTLKKIFGVLKFVTKFIESVLNFALGAVVGFIDLAYAGVENLRGLIVGIGGEGAGELFDKFGRLFTQVMNGALIAATIGAMIGHGRDKVPGDKKKSKWRKALERWFKKTAPGRFIRNQVILPLKLLGRRFSKTAVGRTLTALRPKNIGKFIIEGGIDRTLKSAGRNLLRFGENQLGKLELGKKITNLQLGKKITNLKTNLKVSAAKLELGKKFTNFKTRTGNVLGSAKTQLGRLKNIRFSTPQFLREGSGFRTGISSAFTKTSEAIKKRGTQGLDFAKSIPQRLKNIKWGKLPGVEFAKNTFSGFTPGKWIKNINLPSVTDILDGLKSQLGPNIDKLVKKTPFLKNVTDPKSYEGLMAWIKKSKAGIINRSRPFLETVKNNKGMLNKMGLTRFGAVIDALSATVDYGLLGESLINAIVKTILSTLGFAAAVGLATLGIGALGTAVPITAPWLATATPVILFGAGMLGSDMGLRLADPILHELSKIPWLQRKDPLFPDRDLIRDPKANTEGEKNNLSLDQNISSSTTTSSANLIASSDGNNTRANGLDTKTTYDKTVVIHDTTYIQPIEV